MIRKVTGCLCVRHYPSAIAWAVSLPEAESDEVTEAECESEFDSEEDGDEEPEAVEDVDVDSVVDALWEIVVEIDRFAVAENIERC